MGSERLRLLCAAFLWLGAGACGHVALLAPGAAARHWVAVVVLVALGLVVAWPLVGFAGHRGDTAAPPPEPPPPADPQPLHILQAQLEHLPVAAWVHVQGRVPPLAPLLPLTSRARRLTAPGAVRSRVALTELLGASTSSGPVLLDTERGSERWQLLRQPLALDGQSQTLLVLVPLENELESESLVAWLQLVQVLTHEIMNSLTPIQSLSQTALMLLDEQPRAEAELRSALDGITRRAEGLSRFVATYRRVSQWPPPSLAPVDLQELFARLRQAVAPAWAACGGVVSFDLASPSLRLQADEAQLEQALLALLSNAARATAQATVEAAAPRLWVQARQGRGGRLYISVRDNGPGVPPGLERKIFLPFFSATDGGQGIGLTVVRQLVHGMGGRVRHVRPLEGGAAFVLSF